MALIDEQDAIPVVIDRWEINAVGLEEEILCEMCENPMHTDRGCDGLCSYDKDLYKRIIKVLNDRMKPLQPDVPVINVGDMISRDVAMEMLMAQNVIMDGSEYHNGFNAGVNRAQEVIRNLPTVQPTITHEQAIDYLHETGWLQNHDRILTESKIVPTVQPKHGEWEYHSNPTIGINPETAYCSCCGFRVDTTGNIDFDEYNFCPHCGVKMER